MKLVLQIALGVFIGTLLSQLVVDAVKTHREQQAREHFEKMRAERDERIRSVFSRLNPGNKLQQNLPPPGGIPKDAQQELMQGE